MSAIVVCLDAAKVIGRCLEHLLAQDYPDYEIVVVDDGSRDRTKEIAEVAAAGSDKITVFGGRRNRGCAHARNIGMRHARGEILAFIDADGFAAPDWLRRLVAAFACDETIGGVASTVFFHGNPLVLNGAGGTANRQGWAADLSMNESYECAELTSEALYPMGCGMALRRAAVERVGPFDERIVNYYDDVDYGVRLWRAGYRVVVAEDAWVEHGYGQGSGGSSGKRLLCERHRMRVVLKHSPSEAMRRWLSYELQAIRRAGLRGGLVKLRAAGWNLVHLPSALAARWRLRGAPPVSARLLDSSWGEGFPAGRPPLARPRPESAGGAVEMVDERSADQLPYGWYPCERVAGHSYRWAGAQAAALIALRSPVRRLRLEYAHVPVDSGGVDLVIRRLGSPDPLAAVWSTHLAWQYLERSVENHPLRLPAGDYELVFSARKGWSNPPLETRTLGLALERVSFEQSYEIPAGDLDMGSAAIEEVLLHGWFEAEREQGRAYRWAGRDAAVVVRLAEVVGGASLSFRFPPGSSGALHLAVRPLETAQTVWGTRIPWREGEWLEESLSLQLAAGEYMVAFHAEATWSNVGQVDAALPPENRSLGFALASLSFAPVR